MKPKVDEGKWLPQAAAGWTSWAFRREEVGAGDGRPAATWSLSSPRRAGAADETASWSSPRRAGAARETAIPCWSLQSLCAIGQLPPQHDLQEGLQLLSGTPELPPCPQTRWSGAAERRRGQWMAAERRMSAAQTP